MPLTFDESKQSLAEVFDPHRSSAAVRGLVARYVCLVMVVMEIGGSFNVGGYMDEQDYELVVPYAPFVYAWCLLTLGVVYSHWVGRLSSGFIRYWSIVVWNINLLPVYVAAYFHPTRSCEMAVGSAFPYTLPAIAAAVIGPLSGFLQAVVSAVFLTTMCGGGRSESVPSLISRTWLYWFSITVVVGSIWLNARLKYSEDRRIEFLSAHAELLAGKTSAERESRYKTEFISRMTHELKTPLAVLTSATEYLINRKEALVSKPEEVDHWMHVQLESCGLLRSLLDNVLVLHRIEAGQQRLARERFAMADVAQEAAKMLAVSANLKNIRFHVTMAAGVAREAIGDSVRVRQILMNLGGNAIRFTDEGYVHAYIDHIETINLSGRGSDGEWAGTSVSARKVTPNQPTPTALQRLRIRVEDSGVGMTEEQQAAVLNPSSTVVPERGGCGLGLRIVHHLCEAMDGRMWIECDGPGHGTTFIAEIVLPIIDSKSRAMSRNNSHSRLRGNHPFTRSRSAYSAAGSGVDVDVDTEFESKPQGENGVGGGDVAVGDNQGPYSDSLPRSVLLVEDNTHLQALISLQLGALGHVVTVAGNGAEGLQLFKESVEGQGPSGASQFDIILMDVRMPVMNGLESTAAIREVEEDAGLRPIPIIAMTAHSLRSELMECCNAGCTGYQAKPVDAAMLASCVASLGESTTTFDSLVGETPLASPLASPHASPPNSPVSRHVLSSLF